MDYTTLQCNVPEDSQSSVLVRAYLRNEDLTEEPLFRTGKYKDQHMSYETALYQWTKLCEQAGVKCEIHQLRHMVATEMVNSGVGVGTVRRLLGHRNLQTTQC